MLDNQPIFFKLVVIILLGAIVASGLAYVANMFVAYPTANAFISKCNELYGESNWQVDRLNDYITYSNDFIETHPIVYESAFWDLNQVPPSYSCFKKR